MTLADLQKLLATPLGLFVLMALGSLLSIFKQLQDARKNGSTISAFNYLFRVETVIMLITNTLMFVGLVMTGDLNWQTVAAGFGLGYMANSTADLKPGGRSAAVIDQIKE